MILVTGGAGYIGSHCVLKLLSDGIDVIVFDSLELGHRETIETLKRYGSLKFVQGNLKNIDDIRGVFMSNKNIESVIHFAGYSQVAESIKNPQKYYYNNVYGTLNLLNAMLEFGVKQIVFSSSAAVYGEPKYTPIDENHQLNPINPYGNSKLIVEKILSDYDKAYGLKSVSLRYFNACGADSNGIIGEMHNPETHLIPNILKSDKEGSLKLFGTDYDTKDGTCVRDYINIDDLINAHILALKYLQTNNKSDCFNLGTGEGNSVKEIIELCEKIMCKPVKYEIHPRRTGDPAVLTADNTKAKEILNWIQEKTLSQSIQSAYEWEKYKNSAE